jgi:hypothetical protein
MCCETLRRVPTIKEFSVLFGGQDLEDYYNVGCSRAIQDHNDPSLQTHSRYQSQQEDDVSEKSEENFSRAATLSMFQVFGLINLKFHEWKLAII